MIASQSGSDRSDCGASSLSYEEFFSVLTYYGMSKSDILNSSRKYLYGIYQQYVKRACENLGVSPDGDSGADGGAGTTKLSDSDYPSEFFSISQEQRDKDIEESGVSDEEFLSRFSQFKPF